MQVLPGALIVMILACCTQAHKLPNVILIMADDMGYECLSINGAIEYSTPVVDKLSTDGIHFSNAFSQPLCTPSRVKIMTGKYNYKNYEFFGYLNPNEKTFGNLMKEAGYSTCISGKWQLNGLSFQLEGYQDMNRPHHFGFDEYCLWQLDRPRKDGERYADPLITQNGVLLTGTDGLYGPDIFSDFVCDFIEKKREYPFFIYYPMVLVHEPFVPTPDQSDWMLRENRYKKDTSNFAAMMAYTDKIVGKIQRKLEDEGLLQNTILIFTADNGTDRHIITSTAQGRYRGGKSFTTQRGIHVPMVVSWPGSIRQPRIFNGIIDFADFYPTLAEMAGLDISDEEIDGQSFWGILTGEETATKESTLIHYDPEWGQASAHRNRFAMTERYKLYQNGSMYDVSRDIDEVQPLSTLDEQQLLLRYELHGLLQKAEKESPWQDAR
jgi:arylsulfatase A